MARGLSKKPRPVLRAGREVRILRLRACTVELCLLASSSTSMVRFNANQLRFAAWPSFAVAFAWCRDIFKAVQTVRFARVSLKDLTEVCVLFCCCNPAVISVRLSVFLFLGCIYWSLPAGDYLSGKF